MPKIRAIHPGFWNDTTLSECSALARLFYIGIWNFADDAGVFEWHDRLLKSQIFPFDDNLKVGKLLNELAQHNRILSFIHNGKKYGLVVNFTKYQKPDSRYVRYTIGDYDHVKNLSHSVDSERVRREPPTDGDGDGVSDGDDEGVVAAVAAPTATEVVDTMEDEFRQLLPIASQILGHDKQYSDEGLKCWRARRKKYAAEEIIAAFRNLENESDGWKIEHNGYRPLSWWLEKDKRIEDMKICHLKGQKRQVLFAG